jgi:hypothetical protein
MNTHRRPGFDAGIRPRLALQRTSSGCIFKKPAASVSVSVFIGCRARERWGLPPPKRAVWRDLAACALLNSCADCYAGERRGLFHGPSLVERVSETADDSGRKIIENPVIRERRPGAFHAAPHVHDPEIANDALTLGSYPSVAMRPAGAVRAGVNPNRPSVPI